MREECDERFRRYMVYICYDNEDRYRSSYGSSWSDLKLKMKGMSLVAKGIMHWFFEDSRTLKHCLIGAQMYYDGVFYFSKKYYMNHPMDECALPCAETMGTPHLSIEDMYPELFFISGKNTTIRIEK